MAKDDEKKKKRMILGYKTLTHITDKSELKRGDDSGHGTFHCGLEGQNIKAAGEGNEAGQSGVGSVV